MRAVRREGQMVKGEERRVKRLNVKVLVKLAAIALVVLAALALGRDATLAHGSGWGRLRRNRRSAMSRSAILRRPCSPLNRLTAAETTAAAGPASNAA